MSFFKFKSFFKKVWERICFSPVLQGKSISRKIAYLGLLTAFTVVANAYFEIKLGEIQYSLTIFVCALVGMIVGSGYGFIVCFLGDWRIFAMDRAFCGADRIFRRTIFKRRKFKERLARVRALRIDLFAFLFRLYGRDYAYDVFLFICGCEVVLGVFYVSVFLARSNV